MSGTFPIVVLVTSPDHPLEQLATAVGAAARALPPGLVAVLLRDKTASRDGLLASAGRLRDATAGTGARLLVNGALPHSLEVAHAAGADGVHVPGDAPAGYVERARDVLGADAIVTVAAHDDDDVRRAVEDASSAVLVSPVFATPGKGPPRGVAALRSARALAERFAAGALARPRTRIIALGGITPDVVAACADAGADGVAVIRAWLARRDPQDISRATEALAAPFMRPHAAHGA